MIATDTDLLLQQVLRRVVTEFDWHCDSVQITERFKDEVVAMTPNVFRGWWPKVKEFKWQQ